MQGASPAMPMREAGSNGGAGRRGGFPSLPCRQAATSHGEMLGARRVGRATAACRPFLTSGPGEPGAAETRTAQDDSRIERFGCFFARNHFTRPGCPRHIRSALSATDRVTGRVGRGRRRG